MQEELFYPNLYLCGKAGAGKSTVANMLVSEFGYRRAALADGVKLGAEMLLRNLDDATRYIDSLFDEDKHLFENMKALKLYKENWDRWLNTIYSRSYIGRGGTNNYITPRVAKKDYREFMQWWGTDVCRTLDAGVWIRYYFNNNFFFESPTVCDDVRFSNEEYVMCCAYQFTGIHITCDTISTPASLTDTQAAHESEQYEPKYCKYAIHNDGDLEQLNSRLHEIIEEITNNE